MAYQIIHGDCLEVMQSLGSDSIDAIVTDPPYGLGFMGKKWDELPPGREWATECLRVLKPGGHILAFGGTRTWHRLAVAVEDAGFEIRDSIAWMHSQGFPKHRTALKPAFEPIVMGRKPFKGSLAANEATNGTGALDIDGCRIAHDDDLSRYERSATSGFRNGGIYGGGECTITPSSSLGRHPANVVLDGTQAESLDRQAEDSSRFFKVAEADEHGAISQHFPREFDAPFKYAPKAPKRERPVVDGVAHPTVKPLDLMRWLVRLVTPEGGTVLDPFAGSGTTLEAAILEGFKSIGIEREAEYLPLIQARLDRSAA